MRWLPRLSAGGKSLALAAVVLYACGVALGYRPLLALAVAAVAGLVAGALFSSWRPRLRLARSFFPRSVTAGEPAVALLEVDNRSRWPSAPLTVIDRVGSDDTRLAVRAIRPGGHALVRYPLPTRRRGRIPLGPLRVERSDPLGLTSSAQDHGHDDLLWVHPRTWPMAAPPAGFVVDLEGPVSESALQGSLTFSSLREYAPGDDRRLIHWRSSARLDQLMVRQYVDTNEPTGTVVLDTRSHLWTEDSFEDGVEVAASVAAGLEAEGHTVKVHIVGLPASRARRLGAVTVADRLAAAGRVESAGPAELVSLAVGRSGRGSLVVVSGLLEPAIELMLSRVAHQYSTLIVCSVVPGVPAVWRRRRGVTVVRGPSARALAWAWNRMNRQ
ncbi:MAG: DUF58 domain-containing protein [Acidimicrobiales bacterium]|nr:DUF58 domain-containing protein [Acidimicrobiales bacterium]